MITERLPLYEEAKSENVQGAKLSARKLLEQADENDDMVLLAGMIYSKVEENLISKYKLPHKNEKFYMSYGEYLKAVNEAKMGDRYFLMERDKNGILKPIPPRVLESEQDGTPRTVEMHPLIRFMKAGLSPQEAKKATEMWRILNKIRHKSEENKNKLTEFFKRNKPRKAYMKDVLDFYQEKWLYTEDSGEMQNLYAFLTEQGYKVFYSPISMREFVGSNYYDAYIYNALEKAQIMILYGSKAEYFTSSWIENEWTRYIYLIGKGQKPSCFGQDILSIKT